MSSPPPRLVKIMMAQYQEAMRRESPHIIFLMDEQDIRKWYFMTCGMEGVHQDAEYYYSIKAPDTFPRQPPKEFVSYTNRTMFDAGGKICVSIGEFHANSWVPALGMFGFADAAIVGGVIDYESYKNGGIRIKHSSPEQMRRCAEKSHAYNKKHNPELFARFEEYIRCNPQKLVVRRLNLARAGALGEHIDMLLEQGVTPEQVRSKIAAGVARKDLPKALCRAAPTPEREPEPEPEPKPEPEPEAERESAPSALEGLDDFLDELGI